MSTSAVRTVCGSSARTGLCGGRSAMTVPTAINSCQWSVVSDQPSAGSKEAGVFIAVRAEPSRSTPEDFSHSLLLGMTPGAVPVLDQCRKFRR